MFVCLCLDHALTAKHRDTIFGMDTHVAPGSKIGYVILTSKVTWGHQRSKTVNWGHWVQILKTTYIDAIFFFIPYFKCFSYTIDKYIIGYYVILTSKVTWGHQRSKTVNWGHWVQILKTTYIDAIFFFIPYFKCFSYTIDKYIIQTKKQQNKNHKLNVH